MDYPVKEVWILRIIMMEAYGASFSYDEYAKEASRMYHERYDGGRLPMKTGVVELLSFLKKEGKKIALASSTRRQTVMQQLQDAGILPFFDEVICGDMVENSKPAPDIFLAAADKLGVKAEHCLVLEDSYNGVKAGRAAGCTVCMVPDVLPYLDELKPFVDHVLPSLTHVIPLLEA